MRLTVFTKTVILLVLLLVPILLLYSYANRTSVDMIVEEKKQSSLNQFHYFSSQVDKNIEQLSLYGLTLLRDPSILHYRNINDTTTQYDKNTIYLDILDKLALYQSTNQWMNDITIYFPQPELVLSTISNRTVYDEKLLRLPPAGRWSLVNGRFTYVFTDNYLSGPVTIEADSKYIMEVNFNTSNVVQMLDDYKETQGGDPFFYSASMTTLLNRSADDELAEAVIEQLHGLPADRGKTKAEGNRTMEVKGRQYLVSYVHSAQMDGYYINPVLLDRLLDPLDKSRNMFVISTLLLLGLSIGAALLLYRKVQIPISRLMQGLTSIRKGNFSARIPVDHVRDEFAYVSQSFNHMAEQIQELVENVYVERIRSREATLKHLQSQINPHFLYNCLFYIKNMTMLGNKDAVVAMTLNLGEYYRYITRSEKDTTTVEEEIRLLENYLTIQQLRTHRLSYEISVPEEMLHLSIPRLLIQPIVENAVIHGVEPFEDSGHIIVTGTVNHGVREGRGRPVTVYSILVQNDGVSLGEWELQRLQDALEEPMGHEIGTGTWNVHQRLVTRYGRPAGLYLENIPCGGLSVEIRWVEEEEEQHGQFNDCG
ncbi:histidine kinase [Paenibacillus sp. JX-17]|uniref:Histidine kinase n=1 Tax=Paenibacillus lacisoli TaxID=3064525 RepID=A0ABT9CFC2_9BACL|nr:histidine kinase [Paenibacillus sp. JX-17]MDO7907906.1 histidine kinase [Paenibacillus sp. JX-17]